MSGFGDAEERIVRREPRRLRRHVNQPIPVKKAAAEVGRRHSISVSQEYKTKGRKKSLERGRSASPFIMSQNFSLGDLVWAKMKGFPPWPGMIKEPPEEAKAPKSKPGVFHCVYFFGSKNYGWIEESCIKLYERNEDEIQKSAKTPAVMAAVREMEDYIKNSPNKVKMFEQLRRQGVASPMNVSNKSDSKRRNSLPDLDFLKSDSEHLLDGSFEGSYSTKSEKKKGILKWTKSSETTKDKKTPKRSLYKKEGFPGKKSFLRKESLKRHSSASVSKPKTKKKYISNSNNDFNIDIHDRPPPSLDGSFSFNPNYHTHIKNYYSLGPRPEIVNPAIPELPPLDVHYVSDIVKNKTIVPSELTFGFLGTGLIGSGIIKNLVHTKHKVVIWNRSPDKSEPFKKIGVEILQTPCDVVSAADITFCCVSDSDAAKNLVFGNCGVISEMKPNKAFVEMSGIEPEASLEIFNQVSSAGGKYLEVRLLGNRKRAEDGSLIVIAAGDSTIYRDCESCFQAMSTYSIFIDCEIGSAAKASPVVQLMHGTTICAVSEALVLAERMGVEKEDFLSVVETTQMSCPLILDVCAAIRDNNFSTNLTLAYLQKGIKLALNLGEKHDQRLPFAACTNEMFIYAKKLGFKLCDSAAVFLGARM